MAGLPKISPMPWSGLPGQRAGALPQNGARQVGRCGSPGPPAPDEMGP
jgi:hypothetical protein